MKLVIVLLYNNLFKLQVICSVIYRRRSIYSFLLVQIMDWRRLGQCVKGERYHLKQRKHVYHMDNMCHAANDGSEIIFALA